jgi:DNA modification methylase
LRSYLLKDHPDKAREIGSEATPEAYVETMVQVFREVRRCLTDSGTLWMNLGDSFFGSGQRNQGSIEAQPEWAQKANRETHKRGLANGSGLKFKDLCMIPWRVALALQADGWWLRSVIVWHKRSCMPESVTDRPTNSWEPIFLLAKSQKYFYDAEAVKEKADTEPHAPGNRLHPDKISGPNDRGGHSQWEDSMDKIWGDGRRNQRNVWSLGPEPYSEAHFATFPTEIPKRAILAGTSAKGCCPKCYEPWERVVEKTKTNVRKTNDTGKVRDVLNDPNGECRVLPRARTGEDFSWNTRTVGWQPGCECNAGDPIPNTVLDPFGGSGTTGMVALELGRKAVLIELNSDYVNLIRERCNVTPGLPLPC